MTNLNRTERVIIPSDTKLQHWGYGEWVEEPDEVTFYYKGVKCDIKRCYDYENSPLMFGGHLCGYVVVPANHPWNSESYDDLNVCVHGGLTYDHIKDTRVIGFDCAHSRDLVPSIEMFSKLPKDAFMEEIRQLTQDLREKLPGCEFLFKKTYKNIAFVEAECKKLVDQMLEVKAGTSFC